MDKDNQEKLPVCHRSSSKLLVSVCTMLKDAATLSCPGLVKQVLSSRDSCWLASANGAVASCRVKAEQHYRLLQQQQKDQLGSPLQQQQQQQ